MNAEGVHTYDLPQQISRGGATVSFTHVERPKVARDRQRLTQTVGLSTTDYQVIHPPGSGPKN